MTRVLVLGGGPDREREVSLASARAVASALQRSGTLAVACREIDRPTLEELRGLEGDVVFPVLHGPWGEGGPLQELLEADGRPYVGSGPEASRHAMDKLRTLESAAELGIATAEHAEVFSPPDEPPVGLPCVLKPIDDGSSVGLVVVRTREAWARAVAERWPGGGAARRWMCERYIEGREVTVGMLGGRALPLVEIAPASGVYDYDAKYARDDTGYIVDPDLPGATAGRMRREALALCERMGVRHLARVDFIVDGAGTPRLLEVNTMPGFTDHSLLPMAAQRAGMELPALCEALVGMARNGEASMAGASA